MSKRQVVAVAALAFLLSPGVPLAAPLPVAQIQFGLNHPRLWAFSAPPSVGLTDPSNVACTTKKACKALALLDQTNVYACEVGFLPVSIAPSNFGDVVMVYDVKRCVEVLQTTTTTSTSSSSTTSTTMNTPCSNCQDCNGQACIGGVCTACTTDSDCCAPSACVDGECVLF